MKITILSLHLGFGGVEKFVITIANMLSEKYDVEILSTYRTTKQPSFPISEKVTVKYLIDGMVPNREAFKEAVRKKQIFKVLKEGLFAVHLLYLKYKLNKDSVKYCDCDVMISTRYFHNNIMRKYAKKGIIKISTEHNHHNYDETYIHKIVSSLEGFDYFLPISRELTKFYQDKFVGTKLKVMHIPFCIDEPTYYVPPKFEKPVYISVGRLSPEKGTLDLITIFKEIVQKQSDALLHIVGDGPIMNEVRQLVHDYKLENNIVIHGYLNKSDIDKLYCESSIYLMTSFTESFGLVLLEAMACGLPCIAFDCAQGANEIIENGNNGFLIPKRNKELYVDTAIKLFDDKEKLQELSENARLSLQAYSYDNTKEEWQNLIAQCKQ